MTLHPLDPSDQTSPVALRAFLAGARDAARLDRQAKLVSISLAVEALDPLAVLESIYEPGELHFYAERPALATALAGAEAVLTHEAHGPNRFASVQEFIDETLAHTHAIGDVAAPFGGPHFFTSFTFLDETETGEPFPAARVFVPRWQVARAGDVTTAVANLVVAPEAELDPLAARIWRAHEKFRSFAKCGQDTFPLAMPSVPAPAFTRNETGDYLTAVARALELIAAGELQKIVLARAQEVTANHALHPLRLLNGLRRRFPDCYSFSLADGQGGSFIGATPERLARLSQGWLETEALAGSAPRGAGASEDAALGTALCSSEKDLREHRLVLDSIVRRLAPLGLRLEFPSAPGLRRLANVQHLHTPVRAALPESVRLLDAVALLHPTPAVGGSPRAAALARIRELEGFPRGLYAGALGWVNSRGGGEFVVGLRSALVRGATARVFAGAGIVAGSTPEQEFAETELKFQALLDALLIYN